MTLIDRCPRLGKAAYADRFAHLDGKRVSEITGHDLVPGRCRSCGGRTQRHTIRHMTVTGPNRGVSGVFFNEICSCGHGQGSNYRAPWNVRGS